MLKEEDKAPPIEMFQYYVDAFIELGTCRNSSMSLGPIPFTAISEYAKIYGVEDFEEFLYLIRRMDKALMDMEANSGRGQSKKGNNNKGPTGKHGGRK